MARRYYEGFNPGLWPRFWLSPNARHERLKGLVDGVIGDRRDLDLLDVGCATGVLTAHLRRFGRVTGIDFGEPAVRLARELVPGVRFLVGTLDVLPVGERFDLIALFDVLEHIPLDERGEFLAGLRALLKPDGVIFASTPHPRYTEWVKAHDPARLQIIDELVEVEEVTAEAARVGLGLLRYEAYDIWAGSPEYQFLVLGQRGEGGGTAKLTKRGVRRISWIYSRPWGRRLRRLFLAAGLLRHGRRRAAVWMVTGRGRPPGMPPV